MYRNTEIFLIFVFVKWLSGLVINHEKWGWDWGELRKNC